MPFNFCCSCDFIWFRLFYQFYFSLFSYSAHILFDSKLELVICNLGVQSSRCFTHYLNIQILSLQCTCFVDKVLLNLKQFFNLSNNDSCSPEHCPDPASTRKLRKSEHTAENWRWRLIDMTLLTKSVERVVRIFSTFFQAEQWW